MTDSQTRVADRAAAETDPPADVEDPRGAGSSAATSEEPPTARAPAPQHDAPQPPDGDGASAGTVATSPDPDRARTRRRRLALFVALMAAVVIAGAAAYYLLYASLYVSTDDAFIDGEIVRVSPETSGVLVDVLVNENERVEPGTVLARIDPRQATAQLDVAEARLQQAEAAQQVAEAQVGEAEATITARQSSQDAAAVDAETKSDDADRVARLAQRSGNLAISEQDIETARSAAARAEAALAEAKGATAQAKAAEVAAEAQLDQAKAEVAGARAQLDAAQVTVDFLSVQSRIAGHVAQIAVNDGSYVSPGTQLMAIVPDELYVTANFKETQLEGIAPGAPVDLKVDAYPDVAFEGHVDSIQRGAGQAFAVLPPQNATGNFVKVVQRVPVRIVIDSPSLKDYPLGPGMSVVPTVHLP